MKLTIAPSVLKYSQRSSLYLFSWAFTEEMLKLNVYMEVSSYSSELKDDSFFRVSPKCIQEDHQRSYKGPEIKICDGRSGS